MQDKLTIEKASLFDEILEDGSRLIMMLIHRKQGGILVFLPGLEEIFRFIEILEEKLDKAFEDSALPKNCVDIIPLHSSLAFENSKRVL